ncbi:hypothetical protein Hanom_Chr04g00280101 [Helianthus anomalus]
MLTVGGWGDRLAWPSGYNLKFKLKHPAMTWPTKGIGGRHIEPLARPTPGFKPKPQGPRPNSNPPGVVAWAFSPNPRPNPSPYPTVLVSVLEFKIFSRYSLFVRL